MHYSPRAGWARILVLGAVWGLGGGLFAGPISDVRWTPTPHGKHPALTGDRYEYGVDDPFGQFLVNVPTYQAGYPDLTTRIELSAMEAGAAGGPDKPGQMIDSAEMKPPIGGAIAFKLNVVDLKPGRYAVSAAVTDAAGKSAALLEPFVFTRTDRRQPRIAFPDEGVELRLSAPVEAGVADGLWPVRVGVPMPDHLITDVSRLALFEDGRPIAANITPVATWRKDGAIKWVHVAFVGRYAAGKPASYRLKLPAQAAPPPASTLRVDKTDKSITVDTGAVRFVVGVDRFRGIEKAWLDPTGSGKYVDDAPIIDGAGGPYLKDARAIDFDAMSDANVKVEIEEQGPAAVVLKITGKYMPPSGKVPSLGLFTTRITACPGVPTIFVSHQTTIDFDTRLFRLADVGFRIMPVKAERFHLGADGRGHEGVLPTKRGFHDAPDLKNEARYSYFNMTGTPLKTVFLHQERDDRFRIVGATEPAAGAKQAEPMMGRRSDGWFGVSQAEDIGPAVTVLLRDVWQKFPKELEVGREGIWLHFWPKHGRRAFTPEEELSLVGLYKFRCFHQHPLLDLTLPNDYFAALRATHETYSESLPEHAIGGNGEGLTISNDFAVMLSPSLDVPAVQRSAAMFQTPPAAPASPKWNCATGAMGQMLAADVEGYRDVEEAYENGWLGWHRTAEIGNEYGMWIYADGHTYWNIQENRSTLHRPWISSHYHQVGTNWLLYYRTGSKRILDWGRTHTDHFINISTVGYASRGYNEHRKREESTFKARTPGAMYHCKAPTPWGQRDWGMNANDADVGLWGHWVDPDASLWAWYLDGNFRARDMYDLWTQSIRAYGGFLSGTKREINTSLAYAITFYEQTWDPWILANIQGMGKGLLTQPLEKQGPGPMWHPLWINRYYGLMRDPAYVPLIETYGRWPALENTWTLSLGALAYDLTGDKTYLTQHLPALARFPLNYYHKPGDPYDWWGVGPGPLGDAWSSMTWPTYALALHQAGVDTITADDSPGYYPLGRTTVVYFVKQAGKADKLTLDARNPANMHHVYITVTGPDGAVVHKHDENPSRYRLVYPIDIAAELPAGLYRFELKTYEGTMLQPLSALGVEAQLLAPKIVYTAAGLTGWMAPLTSGEAVTLQFSPRDEQSPGSFRIRDAAGATIASGSLLGARSVEPIDVSLDPVAHPGPWRVESGGALKFTVLSEKPMLLSHRRTAVEAIGKQLTVEEKR